MDDLLQLIDSVTISLVAFFRNFIDTALPEAIRPWFEGDSGTYLFMGLTGGVVVVLLLGTGLLLRRKPQLPAPDLKKEPPAKKAKKANKVPEAPSEIPGIPSQATPELSEKEMAKKLAKLEKAQRKQQKALESEEEAIRKRKEAERLEKVMAEEKRLQEEIAQKEEDRRKQQVLQKELKLAEDTTPAPPKSFKERLIQGLSKTRGSLVQGIGNLVLGKKEIDEETLDDLEELLISADIGVETTQRIIDSITEKVERGVLNNADALRDTIKAEIVEIMEKRYKQTSSETTKPLVLLFIGVNGVGKTTTIGKIAAQYRQEGKKVILGAGDTFRAAAIEQLSEWSKRAEVDIIAKSSGSDPSSVMYEAVQKAIDENYDVVICDTAGRLHTKANLMEELKKMVRVMKKLIPDAPHEVFLVLDATTGQNAIIQAREFRGVTDLTGLIVTKLDGTAKGGVVIGIVNEFDVPVRYIGVGESIDDLRPFDAQQFTESLFA